MKLMLTAAALAFAAFTGFAQAGECPADKMKDGAVATGEMMPKDVTDTVLASIDLAPKGDAFAGEMLRLRKLVIQPGGVVPWHDHANRPANIYVVSGQITEYRSSCAVGVTHREGDVVAEQGEVSHWWRNNTRRPAVLISADIPPPDGEAQGGM